ncbi:MAG: hypothetical protein ACRD4E_18395 [Bryobacteraceae bacterium]
MLARTIGQTPLNLPLPYKGELDKGELEYAKHGKGFGYYGRNKTRLVVYKVADADQQPKP